MEISDQLQTLFSANVEERDDSYVVEVPKQEVRLGGLQPGETYRVAVLPSPSTDDTCDTETEPERQRGPPKPPVEEGEQHTVEIEDIGTKATVSRVWNAVSSSLPPTLNKASASPSRLPT